MFKQKVKIIHHKEQRAFTLVETLVAVSILLVVVVGPMTIAQKGIQTAYYAGDQTTAIYLAQEAIEYVQRLRDNEALVNFQEYKTQGNNGDDNTWSWYTSSSLDACKSSNTSGCDIDFVTGNFRNCTTPSNCQLRTNPQTTQSRVYGYETGWTNSQYQRRIYIGDPVGPVGSGAGGVPITVTVSWDSGSNFGGQKTVVLQTYVYDHYSRFE